MQWILYGPMTAAVGEALARHGHKIHGAEELALAAGASPGDVLTAAAKHQWDILTTDALLSAAPFDNGVRFSRSIVYLQLEGTDVEQDDAVDRLFARYKRLTPGRLYTVTASRVKIRQLPGR